jgi:alpha/beta superfamily hydrolase
MPQLQKYAVTGTAGMLEGIVHLPDALPRAIAVVAHPLPTMGGTMENKVVTTLAKTFVELGCAALRFNFRGTGESQGEFDEGDGETEDVLAVVSHARQLYGELPLILSGFSFGGYVQARAAELLHPQRLVLVAPAVGRYASSAMPQVPQDTLLIHGDKDEVIPLADILHWAKKRHLPIVLLPDATHFFHGRLEQIREVVLNHFGGYPI